MPAPPNLPSRLAALLLPVLLAGCATAGPSSTPLARLSPLVDALTAPVDEIAAGAERGEASAQYGLSVLAADGLRGVPKDPARAEQLRRRATSPKGNQAITQYIPGINGAPGRTAIINMPQYDPAMAGLPFMDGCVKALRTGKAATSLSAACGPTEMYDWLRVRWAGGDAPAPAAWRLASLSCDDEAAIEALWTRAASAFEAGQHATAAAAADRIITACGDAEPSWHARVMRSLIAAEDGDAKLAVRLLHPVPKPAPAPIGGYSSFVALRAHAADGDRAAFARERAGLMAASAAALSKGRTGERFTAGGAQVTALEVDLPVGPLRSRRAFLVTPTGPRAFPLTIHLTTGEDVLGSGKPAWFLDEYRCDGRSTLKYFDASDTPPNAAEVRRMVVERLEGRLQPTSGSQFNRGLEACMFPAQVAPGLGD
jgi:hypothetical protein